MKNLELIGEELFNKVRGRFPSVTIGNQEGVVTNVPSEARFYDFDFKEGANTLGRVSISLDEKSLSVMYSNNIIENQDAFTKKKWYDFLKELRYFAKKRLLNFDTRDINKSNLNRRDYKFLSNQTPGDNTMSESKMYGTSKTSYQDIGNARLAIKHNAPINQELASGRTQHIEAIYIESSEGERFKYPYKHLNGARAMARHVSEGGNAYDDFGKHVTGLSEELSKLRKFKNYMSRSNVMAEGLSDYMDIVIERIQTVKKTLEQYQRTSGYGEAVENFQSTVLEDVPSDVAENWIDQLTIRQFNEELKDVFPYIYKLISEKTIAEQIGPDDILEDEADFDRASVTWEELKPHVTLVYKKILTDIQNARKEIDDAKARGDQEGDGGDIDALLPYVRDLKAMAPYPKNILQNPNMDIETIVDHMMPSGLDTSVREELIGRFKTVIGYKDPQLAKRLFMDPELDFYAQGRARADSLDGIKDSIDTTIENTFEELMGQFAENDVSEGYMQGYKNYHCEDCGCQMHNCKPDCMCEHDSHDETGSWWKDANGNGVPDAMEGNAFGDTIRKAKMNGAKKGDKVMGPDGKEITIENVTDYVLSMYDRETGQFPKGETAVLTAVEKDFGERFIDPAKQFIEMINAKFEEINGYKDPDLMDDEMEESGILYKAGVKKYGAKGMKAIQSAAGRGASHEEIGRIKDQHVKDDLDVIRNLAGI